MALPTHGPHARPSAWHHCLSARAGHENHGERLEKVSRPKPWCGVATRLLRPPAEEPPRIGRENQLCPHEPCAVGTVRTHGGLAVDLSAKRPPAAAITLPKVGRTVPSPPFAREHAPHGAVRTPRPTHV